MQGAINGDVEIVRYASGGQVDGEIVDGKAFKPRPTDDGLLSVNRLGAFHADKEADLEKLREVIGAWMTVRRTGRLAQITSTSIAECLEAAALAFVLYADVRLKAELPDDPSHALVAGIPEGEDDSSIAVRDMIAIKVSQLHLAVT